MKFEDLRVWQLGGDLYEHVHKLFNKKCYTNYFFGDQILRATLSISNNIAEWFERETNNELKRFLYIAKWSCGEVRSMVHIAHRSWDINLEKYNELYSICTHISVMIQKYINTIKDYEEQVNRKEKTKK